MCIKIISNVMKLIKYVFESLEAHEGKRGNKGQLTLREKDGHKGKFSRKSAL